MLQEHKENAQASVRVNEQKTLFGVFLLLFCHQASGNLGQKFLRQNDEHKRE